MPVSTTLISTTSLVKSYGALNAVDGLDLRVDEGDIYGFLGANGSGKTTTVRMLLGLVLATSGEIEVLGQAMPARRAQVLPRVGCLVEGPAAYGHLSGREHLRQYDALGGRSARSTRKARVNDVLEQVGLANAADRKVRGYSLGMRQRLGLAGALLQAPSLLVLDEPTNGLDPQGIHEMRDLLVALNRAGTTIFLSSHLLAEVEQLCTRVGVLDRGRLVLQQSMAELNSPTGLVRVVVDDLTAARTVVGGREITAVEGSAEPDTLVIAADDAAALNADLVAAGVAVRELSPVRRSLEVTVLAATAGSGDVR